MSTQPLSQQTIKNSFFGLLSYVWPILFTIFVTPIIIKKLGIENYGLFILIQVVTGFFPILNFGIIFYFIKELASFNQGKNRENFEKIYAATLSLFLIVGFVSLIISFFIAKFGLNIFNISLDQRKTAATLFYLAGFIGFFNNIAVVYSHIPYAIQRFDISTKIYILNITLVNIGMIISLYLGYGVIVLIFLQLLSSIFLLLIYYIYSKKLISNIRPKFIFEKEIFLRIFRFGFWVYLHNLSSMILVQFDKLLIGSMLGPRYLTFYSLSGTIAEKNHGIVNSLSSIFFPVVAQLSGNDENDKIKNVYRRAIKILSLVAAAIFSAIIIFANKILYFWVGPEIAKESATALYWLSATYFFLAVFAPLVHFLIGLAKIKFLAFSSLLMAILNIILNFILIPRYSILGAAMAYFFSLAPIIFIFYYSETRFFNIKDSGKFYLKLIARLSTTSFLFYFLIKYFVLNFVSSLILILIIGPLSVLAYILLYKILGFFEKEDWELLKNSFKNLIINSFKRSLRFF